MTAIIERPQALIAGRWTADTGGGELVSINPADGSVIARIPACDAVDVDRAAVAADEVHRSGVWSDRSPRERAAVLLRLADLMDRDAELLASLDSREAGKPITECRNNDVPGAIESIRWFAEAADKIYTDVSPTGPTQVGFTVREPVGVVAAILPWNYPLAMAAWKVGPALAAGNCLLLKPADATPLSALHLAATGRRGRTTARGAERAARNRPGGRCRAVGPSAGRRSVVHRIDRTPAAPC